MKIKVEEKKNTLKKLIDVGYLSRQFKIDDISFEIRTLSVNKSLEFRSLMKEITDKYKDQQSPAEQEKAAFDVFPYFRAYSILFYLYSINGELFSSLLESEGLNTNEEKFDYIMQLQSSTQNKILEEIQILTKINKESEDKEEIKK